MEKVQKKRKKYRYLIMGIILIVFILFCYDQNNHLVTTAYTIQNDKIPSNFDGYKIVQISDLHNKAFGKGQERLVKQITALEPDMIVITGDLIDSNHTRIEKAMELTDALVELAPVYYVSGNHEKWMDENKRKTLYQHLEASGVILLDNKKQVIEKGSERWNLVGLEDGSEDELSKLDLDVNTFTILLAHEPQKIKNYANEPVDVVFSGHAHGGQFVLPFVGGVVAPNQGLFPQYTEGIYKEKNTQMIVSRGLGNSVIPIRLFNYPEVVCVTLQEK